MNKPLFDGFAKVSAKEWKQKIQADLKGADYNNTLIWKTNEGIDVKPFYHADEFESVPQTTNSEAIQWDICQIMVVTNTNETNLKAIDALNRGAESLKFVIQSNTISVEDLLKNINVTTITIHFELHFLSADFVKTLDEFAKKSQAQFYINNDIIGNLAKTGNWFYNLKTDHQHLKNSIKNSVSIKSNLSVNMGLYQNAGATMVQQLAYALGHANEYLNHFDNELSTQQKQNFIINFNVAIGTNYFFEIAKLRALRILFKTIATEYNMQTNCHIFVTPTKRNKTIYDYNTNMLRTTTECMSAILGNANTISNLPYDAIYHKSNEFGERMSRYQLLILKHESYFNKVNNPSDGAYYIESLTQQLSKKALYLFKDIEANGGFLYQLKKGIIQKKIKESANKAQEQFDNNQTILLGINKHPNPNDKMKNELECFPFVKTNKRKTLIEPIIEKRLAQTIEQKRLQTEN